MSTQLRTNWYLCLLSQQPLAPTLLLTSDSSPAPHLRSYKRRLLPLYREGAVVWGPPVGSAPFTASTEELSTSHGPNLPAGRPRGTRHSRRLSLGTGERPPGLEATHLKEPDRKGEKLSLEADHQTKLTAPAHHRSSVNKQIFSITSHFSRK